MFAIDGARGGYESFWLLEQGHELDLAAIEFGAAATRGLAGGRLISGGGAPQATDQVVSLFQEGASDFAAGIVSVGQQVKGNLQRQVEDQSHQFVQLGATAPIGENQAFMDAAGQWHRQTAAQGLDQQGDGLAGMAHDEVGFGVASRLLVEAFDGGHLMAFLGSFEAVGQQHQAAAHPDQAAIKEPADQHGPQRDQPAEVQRGGMEPVEEAVVAGRLEPVAADQAGDPSQVGANAEGGQDQDQP